MRVSRSARTKSMSAGAVLPGAFSIGSEQCCAALEDRLPAVRTRFDRHCPFATVPLQGLEHVVSAPRSPWQNAYVERAIGSIRRECTDHLGQGTGLVDVGAERSGDDSSA